MLARWLDRGLGQILAPDDKAASQPIEDESSGILWQILAPDPKFRSKDPRVPPSSAFMSPPPSGSRDVQCVHCHQWTPSKPGSTSNESGGRFQTPSATTTMDQVINEVDLLVLSAAKDTAASMKSPPQVADARNRIFRICSNPRPITEKLIERLRQLLTNDPTLIDARATDMGISVPDGFTPLMAAAACDQTEAVKVILDLSPKRAHTERDLQGRTPLHIAAERGNVEAAKLLRQHEGDKTPPKTDLVGCTPLGRALTSKLAANKQPELEKVLFSPDDSSVFGVKTPAKIRSNTHRELELVAGHADMPGLRINMEDALLCFQSWTTTTRVNSPEQQEKQESWALFAVCDGHNDFGQASKFIVNHVTEILRDNLEQYRKRQQHDELQEEVTEKEWSEVWTNTCLKLDASLKQAQMDGGTTGVFALVSSKSIIVANVGDSRCILVQREQQAPSPSANQETQSQVPELTEEVGRDSHGYVACPLSRDHKPELEEEQDRVKKAGLTVTVETYKDNQTGQEGTIYKISRSENERISMSRAFGDNEYKSNVSLSPEEQAVIAVPEVKMHSRNADRDAFLVLACDGVWDVMTNDDVAKFVTDRVEKELEQQQQQQHYDNDDDGSCLAKVADELLKECLERGSRDNMSVIIVALSTFAEKVSAGQIVRGKTLQFVE